MTIEESFKGILIEKIGLILSGEHPFPPTIGGDKSSEYLLLSRFLKHVEFCLSLKRGSYFYTEEAGKEFSNGRVRLAMSQLEINVPLACLLCNETILRFIKPDDIGEKKLFLSCRDEASSRMETKPTVALEWLLYNIKNDCIDIRVTNSDMPSADNFDYFVKIQLSLGRFYRNIMSESWQKSY